jgi:cobalt-zinc-cadmium efflux system membrane fusion protein
LTRKFLSMGTALLAVLAYVFLRGNAEAPKVAASAMVIDNDSITVPPQAPQWQFLKTAPASLAGMRWTDLIPARVSIDPAKASRVGVPLQGRVTRVYVELGQNVAEGDPLFSIASQDLAALLTDRDRAEVDLAASKAVLERVRAVVATRALPAKEEQAAEQQFRQAELQLRLTESKLAALRVSKGTDHEFTVTSPRAGVVVDKNVFLDQQIAPDASQPAMVVADLSSVWVLAEMFESDARDVKNGAAAEVTSPSLPELRIEGKVDVVAAIVDPAHHTVGVRVRVSNRDRQLRPNVFARVRFATKPAPGTVEVSANALVSDGASQYVYVLDGKGRFVRRPVVAGSVREGRVAVLSGLAPGETVVEEGAVLLDNQKSIGS